jgi:hypothetical protein
VSFWIARPQMRSAAGVIATLLDRIYASVWWCLHSYRRLSLWCAGLHDGALPPRRWWQACGRYTQHVNVIPLLRVRS